MGDMADDRIFEDRREKTDLYVGADLGLAKVAVSDDRVGRFRLLRRGGVRDVTVTPAGVFIATDEDVYVGASDGEHFEATDFGPAVAVGYDGDILGAEPDGTIARLRDGNWQTLGQLEDVRVIEGKWIGAKGGVYRMSEDGLDYRGLSGVRDIADGERPLAATSDGVYRYENGEFECELPGDFSTVARSQSDTHAAGNDGLFEYDKTWSNRSLPIDEVIVDIGYARGIIAITTAGTIMVDPEQTKDGAKGWRTRSLGLDGVTGFAIE